VHDSARPLVTKQGARSAAACTRAGAVRGVATRVVQRS
jgi:hypothetical protein